MGLRPGRLLVWVAALAAPVLCRAEDARQFVQRAVQSELAKDRDDHSRWIYFETDRKDARSVKQWVAETREGSLRRVIELNGQPVPEAEQRSKMDTYVRDTGARSKQRKNEQHDDQQAEELLNLLPQSRGECYIQNKVVKPGSLTANYVCTGKMKGMGSLESNIPDLEHVNGSIHFVGTLLVDQHSEPIEWTATSNALFKSAQCANNPAPAAPANPSK